MTLRCEQGRDGSSPGSSADHDNIAQDRLCNRAWCATDPKSARLDLRGLRFTRCADDRVEKSIVGRIYVVGVDLPQLRIRSLVRRQRRLRLQLYQRYLDLVRGLG